MVERGRGGEEEERERETWCHGRERVLCAAGAVDLSNKRTFLRSPRVEVEKKYRDSQSKPVLLLPCSALRYLKHEEIIRLRAVFPSPFSKARRTGKREGG